MIAVFTLARAVFVQAYVPGIAALTRAPPCRMAEHLQSCRHTLLGPRRSHVPCTPHTLHTHTHTPLTAVLASLHSLLVPLHARWLGLCSAAGIRSKGVPLSPWEAICRSAGIRSGDQAGEGPSMPVGRASADLQACAPGPPVVGRQAYPSSSLSNLPQPHHHSLFSLHSSDSVSLQGCVAFHQTSATTSAMKFQQSLQQQISADNIAVTKSRQSHFSNKIKQQQHIQQEHFRNNFSATAISATSF